MSPAVVFALAAHPSPMAGDVWRKAGRPCCCWAWTEIPLLKTPLSTHRFWRRAFLFVFLTQQSSCFAAKQITEYGASIAKQSGYVEIADRWMDHVYATMQKLHDFIRRDHPTIVATAGRVRRDIFPATRRRSARRRSCREGGFECSFRSFKVFAFQQEIHIPSVTNCRPVNTRHPSATALPPMTAYSMFAARIAIGERRYLCRVLECNQQ